MSQSIVVVVVAYTCDDDNSSVDSAVWPNCTLDYNCANTTDNFAPFDSRTRRHSFDYLAIPCVEFLAMIYATLLINENVIFHG